MRHRRGISLMDLHNSIYVLGHNEEGKAILAVLLCLMLIVRKFWGVLLTPLFWSKKVRSSSLDDKLSCSTRITRPKDAICE